MKTLAAIISIAFVCFVFTLSCSKGSSGNNPPGGGGGGTLDCSTVSKSFATDINPIIQGYCNAPGCHASGSTNGPGPLTNYTQVFNAKAAIRPAIASGLMPQGSSLCVSQKNSFLCWIDSGAPNN